MILIVDEFLEKKEDENEEDFFKYFKDSNLQEFLIIFNFSDFIKNIAKKSLFKLHKNTLKRNKFPIKIEETQNESQ